MGTWGFGIHQDDVAADVIAAFERHLKKGDSISAATQSVMAAFAESLRDTDDGPIVWLALAKSQWTYGTVLPDILERVRSIISSGKGLDRWRDAGEKDLQKRKAALQKFLEKIERPNPKARPSPRAVVRKPLFSAGDCLAITLSNGQFGAALVLAEDVSNPEYGKNLIAVLDYMAGTSPSLAIFGQRQWLRRTHHSWNGQLDIAWYLPVGFRKHKSRISIVGRIALLPGDPKASNLCVSWQQIGEQVIMQREWDDGAT